MHTHTYQNYPYAVFVRDRRDAHDTPVVVGHHGFTSAWDDFAAACAMDADVWIRNGEGDIVASTVQFHGTSP